MSIVYENVIQFPVKGEFSSICDNGSQENKSCLLENDPVENQVPENKPIITAELLADLEYLSKMALREKYHREAHSHKNRKSACKAKGGKFHPEFEDFASFLRHVGLCPADGWTLDRINNANPDYGPGLVRWAPPIVQNNNRSNTVMLTGATGITLPLTEWAALMGVSADTLRQRRRRGATDHQILYGKEGARTRGTRGNASTSEWSRLVPDVPTDYREKLERNYKGSRRFRDSPEPRWRWLAVAASQHGQYWYERLREYETERDYAEEYGAEPPPAINVKRIYAEIAGWQKIWDRIRSHRPEIERIDMREESRFPRMQIHLLPAAKF